MKTYSKLIALALALFAAAVTNVSAQTSNPLVNFLNPTNTFLEAKELNLTVDLGYQRDREVSTSIGARFWISDSQGAAINYMAFPKDDKAEWQIAYGYRTAYKKMELDLFAGMAEDVDQKFVFRPYVEVDAIYQVKSQFGVGLKTQVTDGERPFIGIIFCYKFSK